MGRLFLLFLCIIKVVFFIQNIEGTTEYDTYLHIFSRQHLTKPISLKWTDTKKWSQEQSLQNCSIKLLAHGYAERWNMDWRWDWVAEMKNEMLSDKTTENLCVIAIDWERGAREVNYIKAVTNADIAGLHVADYIQNNNINPKRLHCIGFSLGAHLCAFASNNFYIITKKTTKFARITGLDPAGPLLRKASVDKRLSKEDADFVDCIHTSATFGLQEKSGHMDFFPDGGQSNSQGCEKLIDIQDNDDTTTEKRHRIKRFFFSKNDDDDDDDEDSSLPQKSFLERLRDQIGKLNPLKKVFLNVHAYIGCNHLRSPHYFISSINQCQFRAKLCTSWSSYLAKTCNDPVDNNKTYPRMGFHADKSDAIYRHGDESFYLKTVSEKPYCSSPLSSSEPKSKKRTSLKSKLKKKLSKLRPQKSNIQNK